MDITKRAAKAALGYTQDAQLARVFVITRQALSRIGEDDPLPEHRQWELRAKFKHLFPLKATHGKKSVAVRRTYTPTEGASASNEM